MELAKVGNTIKAILGNSKLTLKICRTYANTAKGNPFIIVGSHGFVEISVSEGNAANVLRTQVGDKVTLVFG
jgi:S-adenosylmethionine hydrolase